MRKEKLQSKTTYNFIRIVLLISRSKIINYKRNVTKCKENFKDLLIGKEISQSDRINPTNI